MEPSTSAPPSEGSRAPAPLNPVHSSGSESLDQSRNASSKRPAQHERYHNAEIKRRKTGAQQAAKVQEKATQLVQQLAAPRSSFEHRGTLAKAEHRQDGYNQSIDEKPWAGNTEQTRHSTHPTAGLTMQTGHYTDVHSPDHKSVSASSHNTEPADSSGKSTVPAKPVEQTKSDRARRSCPLQAPTSAAASLSEATSQSEVDSASHAIQACKEFSSFQKNTRNSKDKSDMASTEERQRDEQTHQHHQQNDPEDAKSLPPVIQQLQRAQQRAHDELEAAEKESSNHRFPAEAGQRFVTNARKHKAKLDVSVYEHGLKGNARAMRK